MNISSISVVIGTFIFKTEESLCSRAYTRMDESWFWWVWVHIFGVEHSYKSFKYYWPDDEYEYYKMER